MGPTPGREPQMAISAWAYQVSDATRREEVEYNTKWLAQLNASVAAGLPAIIDSMTWGDGCIEAEWLPVFSAAAAAAVGLTGEDLGALADLADVDRDREDFKWLPAGPESDWYARGKAIRASLLERFGSHIVTTAATIASIKTAKRRLATAKRALGIR